MGEGTVQNNTQKTIETVARAPMYITYAILAADIQAHATSIIYLCKTPSEGYTSNTHALGSLSLAKKCSAFS